MSDDFVFDLTPELMIEVIALGEFDDDLDELEQAIVFRRRELSVKTVKKPEWKVMRARKRGLPTCPKCKKKIRIGERYIATAPDTEFHWEHRPAPIKVVAGGLPELGKR